MEKKSFAFNSFNNYTENGICQSLAECNCDNVFPTIVCIGSDLVLGDSLGPLVGTFLKKRNLGTFIYGTLNFPVTAKEISYAKEYLKILHPNSQIIAIDAAVGNPEDVGIIKVSNKGLCPGLGVDKNLGEIGDISIIGIVAGRSEKNYNLFNLTRLNVVYKMAEKIANGIANYIDYLTALKNKESFKLFGA